jgi:transcription antitermination factor NusG
MSISQMPIQNTSPVPPRCCERDESSWYAIHTMPRHEKRVAQQLRDSTVVTFLPLLKQVHQWSDRRSKVDVPMFSCYAFVRIVQKTEERLKVLKTSGVLGFVGSERHGTAIPDHEIDSLQTAIREKIPCVAHPFINIGQRVRIRGGALDGVEGILTREGGRQSVVVSVELLRRSISIQVDGYAIDSVSHG